jgi:cytochrome c556
MPASEGDRMKRFASRASVVVGSLAALLLGIAVSQAQMKVGTGDPVADRQRLMKLNGASATDLNDKLKAGQIEAMAVNAETIAITAQHIPALFPEGSTSDKSRAKPEIWQKRAEFDAAAKNLQAKAEELRDAARSKDQAKAEAALKAMGTQGCAACHDAFRKPQQ